jgi:Natural resistance-associated macrophage protein
VRQSPAAAKASPRPVGVPWLTVVWNLVVPHISLSGDYLTVVVAVFGTTISPYLFFWQAGEEVEGRQCSPRRVAETSHSLRLSSSSRPHDTGVIYLSRRVFTDARSRGSFDVFCRSKKKMSRMKWVGLGGA